MEGIPVARERAALVDIMQGLGENPDKFFVPYN
jgi:hypothetical protein